MKISVAMTTYNGAKHLKLQLDSFANQVRRPDELVVCDDHSNDETLDILNKFAETACFEVRVISNDKNLGYTANFEKAISLCTGDIIFLSDQDDYWFSNKINSIISIFESNPIAWLVINDAEITDELLAPTGLTVIGQLNAVGHGDENHIHGCCSAFRRDMLQPLFPIPSGTYSHDIWLHLLGNSLSCRYVTSRSLQYYRRHGSNSSNNITSSVLSVSAFKLFLHTVCSKDFRVNPVEACEKRNLNLKILKERLELNRSYLLQNLPIPTAVDESIINIYNLVNANEDRRAFLMKRFPLNIIGAFRFYLNGGYKNFEGLKSLVKDMVLG
jgi:glycosyltransferase involved in cell wall biosynthesis